jgi:hypothetical protein
MDKIDSYFSITYNIPHDVDDALFPLPIKDYWSRESTTVFPNHIRGWAQNILYNYIEKLNEETTNDFNAKTPFNAQDAIDFCTEINEQKLDDDNNKYGMGMPKTECVMYMNALEQNVSFRDFFFAYNSTTCAIVKYFLTNIFNLGLSSQQIISELGNFLKYYIKNYGEQYYKLFINTNCNSAYNLKIKILYLLENLVGINIMN